MDLSDALGGWGPNQNQNQQQGGGGAWPGQQPPNPVWPGGPTPPSVPAAGGWPGGPSQPAIGGWPGGPSQPPAGGWPGGPSQPPAGGWPAPAPSGPNHPPGPPGGWPAPAPSGPNHPSGPAGGWPSPAPAPAPGPTFPVAPQQSLTMPLKQSFPYGLENKTINVRGTVNRNPDKFTIDFCTASDIAFHFNPRFNEGGRQVIVRNSLIGKKWGREERDGHFPFKAGQNFDMKIEVTRSAFKVTVNGSHLPEYKHRNLNPRDIKQVNLYNDVTLSHFSSN